MNSQTAAWPFPTIMPNTTTSVIYTPQVTSEIKARLIDALKHYREELHESAKAQNIGIVHIYNDGEKGGMTVAYRKCNEFKSGCMVEVAVATCSTDDAFSKKIGVQYALEKFFDGTTIELPLLKTYEPRDISYAVKTAFTALYYNM